MVLQASQEKILRYVTEACRQNKVLCNMHVSPSCSMYYVLSLADGSASIVFRIADHPQKIKTMCNLIVGRSTKFAQVKRFIDRRIALLKTKPGHMLFVDFMRGYGCAPCAGQ